jgi:hypothetical protein
MSIDAPLTNNLLNDSESFDDGVIQNDLSPITIKDEKFEDEVEMKRDGLT